MTLEWARFRLADFDIWASGTSALASNHSSLDYKLRTDVDTSDVVVALLESLALDAASCSELGWCPFYWGCMRVKTNVCCSRTSRTARVMERYFESVQ
jgi:hypothetical protein